MRMFRCINTAKVQTAKMGRCFPFPKWDSIKVGTERRKRAISSVSIANALLVTAKMERDIVECLATSVWTPPAPSRSRPAWPGVLGEKKPFSAVQSLRGPCRGSHLCVLMQACPVATRTRSQLRAPQASQHENPGFRTRTTPEEDMYSRDRSTRCNQQTSCRARMRVVAGTSPSSRRCGGRGVDATDHLQPHFGDKHRHLQASTNPWPLSRAHLAARAAW